MGGRKKQARINIQTTREHLEGGNQALIAQLKPLPVVYGASFVNHKGKIKVNETILEWQ